ncbi:MAG: hypothetical protein NVS3B10_25630 [Polyangiales bacterium]
MPDRSLVAGANALFRAKETSRPPASRILEDRWAGALAERDPRIQAIRFARFLVPPLHRSIDELILGAVEHHGFRQVILVGAGYDMRASRFRDRLDGVRWIEIDHPATQRRKLELLRRSTDARPVEHAAVDLARGSLHDALTATSHDPRSPTMVVAEGLVHYLDAARLDALLGDVARAAPKVRFVFSFIDDAMYLRASPTFLSLVTAVREVPALSFSRADLEARCARHGFDRFRAWSAEEQIVAVAPAARGRALRLSQEVAMVDRVVE